MNWKLVVVVMIKVMKMKHGKCGQSHGKPGLAAGSRQCCHRPHPGAWGYDRRGMGRCRYLSLISQTATGKCRRHFEKNRTGRTIPHGLPQRHLYPPGKRPPGCAPTPACGQSPHRHIAAAMLRTGNALSCPVRSPGKSPGVRTDLCKNGPTGTGALSIAFGAFGQPATG